MVIFNREKEESMEFEHFGAMVDCSRNAVMKVEKLKRFIDCLQKMGYNTLGLYMEDVYELENEPYFGYLRGRYKAEELKEVDLYAKERGIEVIPCIQTLAHFTAMDVKVYNDIIDCNDILLIDEPKTYQLIEKIFDFLSKTFSSKNVNIGMDEAHMVGRGKYLDKHGYCNRTELLVRHLEKVAGIAEKYGFQTQMWSDMFFRLVNGGAYYKVDAPISDEVKTMVPKNVDICYWDYYHTDKTFYDAMIAKHLEFNCGVWFAGGSWTWNGFAPLGDFTLNSMKPAMESVVEHGIKNVLITMWGDDGAECSVFSQLHTLYAIRQFANGNFNINDIQDGFYKSFRIKFSDFSLLDIPNKLSLDSKQIKWSAFCKPLLYADPFMGIFDENLKNMPKIPFEKYAHELKKAGKRVGEFSYLFDELASLCSVLKYKAELGIKTRIAYRKKDKAELKNIVEEFVKARVALKKFHLSFYELWNKENKAYGWEIQDARLGGLMQRLKTCELRLNGYLNGEIERIEELEEDILSVGDGQTIDCNCYKKLISKNVM